MKDIKEETFGRWADLYSHFGVEVGTGEHRACVLCGGVDRFRVDGLEKNGEYLCGQCGAGTGVSLLMKYLSCDFKTVVWRIRAILGTVQKVEPKEKRDPKPALNEMWKASTPLTGSDPVSKYLHGRGLVLQPENVRYCAECWNGDEKKKIPAMVARVVNIQGKPVSLHRTYLDSHTKKLMPGTEKLTKCAIRLFPPIKETIGIAEGVESSIAATQITGIPCWAAMSSTILESFEPPEGIRKIVIFSDVDNNYVGQKAAYALANRLYGKDFIVEVELSPSGTDWNDELIRRKGLTQK